MGGSSTGGNTGDQVHLLSEENVSDGQLQCDS